jgi:hypothetical protein
MLFQRKTCAARIVFFDFHEPHLAPHFLWPRDDFQTTPEAERSIAWTNWPLFTLGLVMRGHRDEDIRKILGGNVLRVLRAST